MAEKNLNLDKSKKSKKRKISPQTDYFLNQDNSETQIKIKSVLIKGNLLTIPLT